MTKRARAVPAKSGAAEAPQGTPASDRRLIPGQLDSRPSKAVAARMLRPAVVSLRTHGIDVDAVLASCGFNPAMLPMPDARTSHETLVQVWRRAEELTADPLLGLHVVEAIDFRLLFDFIDRETEYLIFQLLGASDTVGEGLARFVRYYPVSHLGARLIFGRGHERVSVRWQLSAQPTAPRSWIEVQIVALLKAIRTGAARAIMPVEVRLPHAPGDPLRIDEYARALGCAPGWSAGEASFALAEADLEVPMRCPKPTLVKQLEQSADAVLGGLSDQGSIVERVRSLLAATVHGGPPKAEHTARALAMSSRTLARRLEQEGSSHQEILDEVRARLSRGYLADPRSSVMDVAMLLGYSDVRAFQRAFKRWFGAPPAAFRSG